jgi:DHA1 family inner membrane transport protein
MSATDTSMPHAAVPQDHTANRIWPTLLILAFGAFVIGTSEFLIMGILPDVAASLGVTVGAAGQLVTAFALGIALGAPTLAAATARFDRKHVLLAGLGVFSLGNLAVGLLHSYEALLVARFVSGAMAGLFYGVGIAAGAQIAPENMKARAIATVFGGITLATVLGSPAGIWIGQFMGWQSPFFLLTGLTILAIAAMQIVMPNTPSQHSGGLTVLGHVFKLRAVMLVLLGTVLVNTGWFAAYTYIAPFLTNVTGAAVALIPAILVGYGVLSWIGNMLGGKLADLSLRPTLFGSILIMAASMVSLKVLGASLAATMVLLAIWALSGWSFVTAVQTRIVEAAGSAGSMASALNISAFNVGIALGAASGGAVVESLGLAPVMLVGAAAALSALVPLGASYRAR